MLPFSFSFRPPRHRLPRVLFMLAGLALLALLAVFGAMFAAVVLVGFGLRRLLMQYRGGARKLDPQARHVDPRVIDGEFAVVRKPLPR